MTRSIAAVVVLAVLAGCATPRPAPTPLPPAAGPIVTPPPSVAPPAPPAPPVPPAPPIGSVGPRAPLPREVAPPVVTPPSPPLPPPPTAPPVPPGQRGRFIVLNFDNADIETVIHAASEIAGFNYVLAPDVRGKVTVQTSGRIPQEDVFGVLLAILEVHGFTAIRSGNLYKIVRIEGARERAVPTIIGPVPDELRVTDEVITQIIPVRFASVADLGTLLRPLISSRGTLIAHRETNVLIITDAASNIRRLLDIIRLVDVEVALEELAIIPVAFADVSELAAILTQLFAAGRLRTGLPGAPAVPAAPPPLPAPAVPGVPAPPAAPRPGPAGETGGADRPPLIIAERRSNSLIVHARRSELEAIKRVVAQIDVSVTTGRRVFIYYAENARAKDLVATLNAIYAGRETIPTAAATPLPGAARRPGEPPAIPPPAPTAAPGAPIGGPGAVDAALVEGQIRFVADEQTNSVIAQATPRQWADVEITIRQLDKMPRQVLIEVLVAEITLSDDTRLGIDWALRETSGLRFGQQSLTGVSPAVVPPPNVIGAATTVAGLAGGLTAFAFKADVFMAMLNALAAENRVNIVSSPHVLTSENKKAVINVSRSVPIITSQQVPFGGVTPTPDTPTAPTVVGTQSVEYRDAGVVLTVTPRIGERGTVALDVKQEVNDVGNPVPPSNSPEIIKREAETSVVLMNNQTLVLGGLIRDRIADVQRGIPVLSRIPILGYLFGFKSRGIEKTELLILITPRVIGTALDAARITEEMRRTSPQLDRAIETAPRAPAPRPPAPPTAVPAPAPAGAGAVPAAPVPALPPAGVPPIPPAPPPGTSPSAPTN